MMTISVPKLVLLIIVILAVWYVSRVLNRGRRPQLERRRAARDRAASARPGRDRRPGSLPRMRGLCFARRARLRQAGLPAAALTIRQIAR